MLNKLKSMFSGFSKGASDNVISLVREIFAIALAETAMGKVTGNATGKGGIGIAPGLVKSRHAEIRSQFLNSFFGGALNASDEAAMAVAMAEIENGLNVADRCRFGSMLAALDPDGKNRPDNVCAKQVRMTVYNVPPECRLGVLQWIIAIPDDEWKILAPAIGMGSESAIHYAKRFLRDKYPQAWQWVCDKDDTAAAVIDGLKADLATATAKVRAEREALQAAMKDRKNKTGRIRWFLEWLGFSPRKLP